MSTAPCEQLDLYLDGQLPEEARPAFEAHLALCATCGPAFASWQRHGERLEAWASPFAGAPSAQQLRAFRARLEAPSSAAWFRALIVGGALAVTAALLFVLTRSSAPTEWEISGGEVAFRTTLGSPDAPQRYRIGPDELDLAPTTEVKVVEKGPQRTRLTLTHGVLTARVEPGRQGREFVVDSPPYRVTVVGTVFEVRRVSDTFRVATSKGLVRVDRLGPGGVVLSSKLVPAGEVFEADDDDVQTAMPFDAGLPSAPKPRLEPKPSAGSLLAWRRRAARGECEAVYEETGRALKTSPSHVGMLRVHADCARKLGLAAAAVDAYRKVIAHSSGAEAAEARLLAAGLLQEELHDARGVLEVTKSTRGAPPAVAGALHVRRARAFLALGLKAEARAEVEVTLERYGATPAAADALRLKTQLGQR